MVFGFLSAVFTPMRNEPANFKATLTLDPPSISHDDGWKGIHF
jgi:hypothetical protein